MAQFLHRFFTVLAFRHCVTHVGLAGRPHSLYSRSLFFSSGPSLLLLLYFLLCLGRTAADYPAVENHGGDYDAMIFAAAQAIFWPTRAFGVCSEYLFVLTRFTCGNTFAAAQAIFWPTRVFGVCSERLFVLTRFTCGNRRKFYMSWFQLARAPEGRC